MIIEYFIYAANLTVRRKVSKRYGCVSRVMESGTPFN